MTAWMTGVITRGLCFMGFGLAVTSCAMQQKAPDPGIAGIEIRGLTVLNRSFSPVTEFQVLVTRTREFVSCGNIPMRGQCATTFPLRQYEGNHLEIRWKQGGTEWSTGEFVVETGGDIDPGRPAMVQVEITAQGLAETRLVQSLR